MFQNKTDSKLRQTVTIDWFPDWCVHGPHINELYLSAYCCYEGAEQFSGALGDVGTGGGRGEEETETETECRLHVPAEHRPTSDRDQPQRVQRPHLLQPQ